MADRQLIVWTNTITASPAGASETIIATLGPTTSLYPSQQIKIHGYAAFQPAASTASVVLKIRQTNISGTVVATSPTFNGGDITTPKLNAYDIYGVDSPSEVAGQLYVMTVTLASAGAGTTISAVWMDARTD